MNKGTRVSFRKVDADGKSVGAPLLGTVGDTHISTESPVIYFEVAFDDGTQGMFSEASGDVVDGAEVSTVIGSHASDVLDEAGILVDDAVNEYAGYLMVVMD